MFCAQLAVFLLFLSVVSAEFNNVVDSLNSTNFNQSTEGYGSFDWTSGTYALWHSANAYCSPETYLTRSNKGYLSGFVATYHIYDKSSDTQGYVGYTTSQKTIYVVFRGSETLDNWVTNIDMITVKYSLCENCWVHQGFYSAEQKVVAGIISQVKTLKSKFPSYKVLVTGHSLGAALATLAAADLKAKSIDSVQLFNYGSPRTGDTTFAAWFSSYIPIHSRVTHYKDEVPHLPTSDTLRHYTHINGEYFQADRYNTALTECTGYEDPKCSYQYNAITSGSFDDHLNYLGVALGANGCSAIL